MNFINILSRTAIINILCMLALVTAVLYVRLTNSDSGVEQMAEKAETAQEKVIEDRIIYDKDYRTMYKIGHAHFLTGNYEAMAKLYRPILDEINRVDPLAEKIIFVPHDELTDLHMKVQRDIAEITARRQTCGDLKSCLDVNLVLPVAL
jgi:hypothetical protein